MCNAYLHRLDRAWDDGDGVLARFADNLVVMCWSRSQAEQALARLTDLLAGLGLEPKAAKTRIVHLEEGGEGFDFLGFHHRLVRSRGRNGKKPVAFLARWPSDRAMQHARDRIRELTGRRRLLLWPELIAEDLNRFLRGWAAYFKYGHSAERLSKIRQYARMRLALFVSKKHRRSRNFGWRALLVWTPGLLTWSEIWCDVDNSKRFRSSCSRHVSQGHRLKGVAALHNFLASIFTAPGVTTWRDMSGNTRKNQVTRLVTLRHQSTMSGVLDTE